MITSIKNISYGYQDNHYVIGNLSVDFESKSLTSIVGPNGCGKSTLLKLMSGILSPKQGHIFYQNKNIEHLSPENLSEKRSYFSQFFPDSIQISVSELLDLCFTKTTNSSEFDLLKSKILYDFDLVKIKNTIITQLSGGQQQRVYIARACLQAYLYPDKNYLLFFDEPLNNLDIHNKFMVLNNFKSMVNEGFTIIMVIHDINLATQFSDNICLMRQGKVIKSGNCELVVTKENIEKVFCQPIDIIHHQNKAIIHYKNSNYDRTNQSTVSL